jgi:hypothetical protein
MMRPGTKMAFADRDRLHDRDIFTAYITQAGGVGVDRAANVQEEGDRQP